MKKISLSLATLTLITLSGCGMFKDMSEMHDSTQKMSDTTSGMAATTKDMSATTNGMAKTTSGMAVTTDQMETIVANTYSDLRIGNTRDARQKALEGINESDDQVAKLGYASQYMAAFEYQFWKPENETNQDRLDLMDLAVKDFFHNLDEFAINHDNVAPTLDDPKSQALYSMAATLHYVNLAQTDALKDAPNNTPVVTMLTRAVLPFSVSAFLENGRGSVESKK